jgi:hypothetical protein
MKIELDRKEISCPENLTCTVCEHTFKVDRIRTLLHSDRGLLQGDICPDCLKIGTTGIQTKLKERVWSLLLKPAPIGSLNSHVKTRAAELLEMSEEEVKFPSFWQWWIKKMTILSEESTELEKARLGISNCHCHQRRQLEKLLEKSET